MVSSYRAGLWLPDEKPMFGAKLIKDHPLAKGIVLDTLMNEYGGNIAFDGSGKNNRGEMHNCAWAPRGIDFNGYTSYISCEDDACLNFGANESFTISVGFKTGTSGRQYILHKNEGNTPFRGYFFEIYTDNKLRCALDPGVGVTAAVTSTATVTDSIVHMGLATINRKTNLIKLFLDGKEVDSTDISAIGTLENIEPLYIGIRYAVGAFGVPFSGLMQYVRIWERAFSQPEITLLTENPYCMYEYFPLEEGMLYSPAAIMNQFQRANLGADLMDGVLVI